jgi:hypothetical protein
MQKRLALILIALIVVLTFVPAYYPPDDEALRQTTSLNDVHGLLFTVNGTFSDFDRHRCWTGVTLSLNIFYQLLQNVFSPTGTRAPPA